MGIEDGDGSGIRIPVTDEKGAIQLEFKVEVVIKSPKDVELTKEGKIKDPVKKS